MCVCVCVCVCVNRCSREGPSVEAAFIEVNDFLRFTDSENFRRQKRRRLSVLPKSRDVDVI